MTKPFETHDVRMSTNPEREEAAQPNYTFDSSNYVHDPLNESSLPELPLVDGASDTDISLSNSVAVSETDRKEITKGELGQIIGQRNVRLLSFPIPKAYHDTFVSLQKWEGTVIERRRDIFVARLVDLTKHEPDEIAELPIEDVQEDELKLVEPGAIFLLNIGYLISKSGQRSRQTLLLFRDLPVWQKSDLESAQKKATELWKNLGDCAE